MSKVPGFCASTRAKPTEITFCSLLHFMVFSSVPNAYYRDGPGTVCASARSLSTRQAAQPTRVACKRTGVLAGSSEAISSSW